MYTFKKEERLCSTKMIEKLFSEGKSFMCYPLRVVYYEVEYESIFPVQVLFVAAKKRFRRANKRNLLKRRMREAYRQHKQILYNSLNLENKKIVLAISFVGKEIMEFEQIDKQTVTMIEKLVSALKSSES
jgi:ribonuclease P protein component